MKLNYSGFWFELSAWKKIDATGLFVIRINIQGANNRLVFRMVTYSGRVVNIKIYKLYLYGARGIEMEVVK